MTSFGALLGEAWDAEAADVDPDLAPRSSTRPSSWRCASGALGGKVTGAGGGGYLLFVCEFERKHLVAEALINSGMTVSEFTFSRRASRRGGS